MCFRVVEVGEPFFVLGRLGPLLAFWLRAPGDCGSGGGTDTDTGICA